MCDECEKLKKQLRIANEKVRILNEMSQENYEKYCSELKKRQYYFTEEENKKLEEYLQSKSIEPRPNFYNYFDENYISEKDKLINWLEDRITTLNEDIVNSRCQQNEIKRLRGYQEILDKVRGGDNE